ncbi:MAG: aspartate--tRNA ligase [Thermoplasmatales archaeon]|nr:aspartate--tRNA ligase [Thermoplasmatales archaeon]
MKRTHTCGELGKGDLGKEVCLQGWVRFSRDHGGVAFVDLADRYGTTQVVFDPENLPEGVDAKAIDGAMKGFSRESVVSVVGIVRDRVPGTEDPRNPTGEVEVMITSAEVLNRSAAPPMEVGDQKEGVLPSEDVRLRYRYVDLRRSEMVHALEFRCKFLSLAREYLLKNKFLEIETPMLGRSTPEGARDYVVPSRLHPGKFYALPQSPQLFKQMLMVGGMDRYFQVARCFRDEDSRSDRQPEFTQLDMEMSFVDSKDIQDTVEGLLSYVWKGMYGTELETPFLRMPFEEALEKYGTDKPDIRFGLPLVTLTDVVREAPYGIFQTVISRGGVIKGINVKGSLAGDRIGRNEVDRYIEHAKKLGLGGLTWMRAKDGTLESNIVKYFTPGIIADLMEAMDVEDGDLLFLMAGPEAQTVAAAGQMRLKLGQDLGLAKADDHRFLWLVDCPMFEVDPVTGAKGAYHHPFVLPTGDPHGDGVGGECFDLVLDGNELGSGSMRIHNAETQREVFRILGMSEEEIDEKFGFFVEALGYGAPPHGGIALGIDRFMAVLLGKETIRETIAFPKNKRAQSPFDGSPETIPDDKLEELQIMTLVIDDLEFE